MSTYTPGCYGDGAFGHQHTRSRCALIVSTVARSVTHPGEKQTAAELEEALEGEPSEDLSEEDDACNWLNTHATVDGHSWGWNDGDFGLWVDSDA